MPPRVLLALLLSALAPAACSSPAVEPLGQVMVALGTDMTPGRDFDEVFVYVKRSDEKQSLYYRWKWSSSKQEVGELDGSLSVPLPATVAIVGQEPSEEPVLIKVAAYQSGVLRVLRQAAVKLPAHGTDLLRMPIEWLCYDRVDEGSRDLPPGQDLETLRNGCDADPARDANLTCAGGACVDVEVASSDLTPYTPESVFGGGTDSSAGGCFDVLSCFAFSRRVTPAYRTEILDGHTTSVCAFPWTGTPDTLNVALVVPAERGHQGFCNDSVCLVPLDRAETTGWMVSRGRIQEIVVPDAVCEQGLFLATSVSNDALGNCPLQKLPGVPPCGEWSSVTPLNGAPPTANRPGAHVDVVPPVPGCPAAASRTSYEDTTQVARDLATRLGEIPVHTHKAFELNGVLNELLWEMFTNGDTHLVAPAGFRSETPGVYALEGDSGTISRVRYSDAQGQPITADLFDLDSYLVGATFRKDLSNPRSPKVRVSYKSLGPLAELLGLGATPPNPIVLSLSGLKALGKGIRSLRSSLEVVSKIKSGDLEVQYTAASTESLVSSFVAGGRLALDLVDAKATETTTGQVVTPTSWKVSHVESEGGVLDGSAAFTSQGGEFPFDTVLTWDRVAEPAVEVSCETTDAQP